MPQPGRTPTPDPRGASLPRADLDRLRRAVAAIEGSPAGRLDAPRTGGRRPVETASEDPLDGPLAGFPAAGLTEIHVDETRGGGSGAGFVLALASRLGAASRRPLLWVGQSLSFRESGRLYAPGLLAFGFDPGALLLVETRREEDALWVAEEAGRSGVPAAVVLEVRGNPGRLSLEGTRRLHVRSREAGVPLLLLRQAGRPEPTAAPLRLRVRAAEAASVPGLADVPHPRPIGHPVFQVAVEKSRDGRARRFLLEWNPHDRRLDHRPFDAADAGHALPGARLSPPVHRPDPARAARPLLAFPGAGGREASARAAGAV